MPWIVQQVVEIFLGLGIFLVYAIAGVKYSVGGVFMILLTLAIATYFLVMVSAHYMELRRSKKQGHNDISNVLESKFFTGYEITTGCPKTIVIFEQGRTRSKNRPKFHTNTPK